MLGTRLTAVDVGGHSARDPVQVLLRPEAIEATLDDAGAATAIERSFLGASTRLEVALLKEKEILVQASGHGADPTIGATVTPRVRTGRAAIADAGTRSGAANV